MESLIEEESAFRNLPLTMVAVWDELTPEEREGLCRCCGMARTEQGLLAMTTISKILKALYYRSPYFMGEVAASPSQAQAVIYQHTTTSNSTYGYPVPPPGQKPSNVVGSAAPNPSLVSSQKGRTIRAILKEMKLGYK